MALSPTIQAASNCGSSETRGWQPNDCGSTLGYINEGAEQSPKPRANSNTLSRQVVSIVPPANAPAKGWNISHFCSLLWHLAPILVWQGFERPFPHILPNVAPKRSTPFYFAVSYFLSSPKQIYIAEPAQRLGAAHSPSLN